MFQPPSHGIMKSCLKMLTLLEFPIINYLVLIKILLAFRIKLANVGLFWASLGLSQKIWPGLRLWLFLPPLLNGNELFRNCLLVCKAWRDLVKKTPVTNLLFDKRKIKHFEASNFLKMVSCECVYFQNANDLKYFYQWV